MNVSIRLIRIFYHTFIHQKNVLEYVKELILVSNISSRRKVESFKKNVSRNAIKRQVNTFTDLVSVYVNIEAKFFK